MSVALLPPTASDLSDRLALILAGLRAAVAARMARDRSLVPLLMLLWSRLHRMAARFARVAVTAPSPEPAWPACAARPSGPPDRLPRGVAWLLRLMPEAAIFGAQLRALLADPAMEALLAAAPQAGRIVRPLCRMLAAQPSPVAASAPPGPEVRPADSTPLSSVAASRPRAVVQVDPPAIFVRT